jgi:diguanylate cyclase (GGDEF)-like protein
MRPPGAVVELEPTARAHRTVNVASALSHRRLAVGGGVALAWVLLWALGILGEYTDHASIWYPPAALTFAALLVMGWRALPFLFAAVLVTTYWSIQRYGLDLSPLEGLRAGVIVAAAHFGAYGLGAWLLRRLARKAQGRLPLVIIDFLLVAVVVSLLAAALGVFALYSSGMLPRAAVSDTWMPFWVGDMVAVIVLAPLFANLLLELLPDSRFLLERPEVRVVRGPVRSFALKLLVCVLFVSAAMLLTAWIQTLESAFIVFFLIIPQMWLTYSEHPERTALSVALNSAVVVGWMYGLELGRFVFVYQFAIAIVAATAYIGIAMPLLVADNAMLRRRVMRDSLTGAASRDFIIEQTRGEIERSLRSGSTLCLMVIDLDRFKPINDELGHALGDRTLARVHDAARGVLRASDVLARYGGDEFVALLPDTELDIAVEVAERVRTAIGRIEVVDGRPLTASIGVSELVADDGFETLFERADLALYEAKRSGRDAVRARRGWEA